MNYFKNKSIWVTGASSGIGKELVLQLSHYCESLIISARNKEELISLKKNCDGSCDIRILTLDLENHEQLETIFNENRDLLEQVNIVFHNAGVSQRAFTRDSSFDIYKRMIDINYLGTIKLSLLLLPTFLKNHGHFVVVSSSAGKFGVPFRSGYSASKFALHGFFESLMAEEGKNLIVTIVCPGFIKTNLSINAFVGDGSKHDKMDRAQAEGMDVTTMVKKMLLAVSNQKREVLIGGFRETIVAVWLSRIFPSVFRKIIAVSRVT